MELGCHSWMDCLTAELYLNSCFSDTVALFCMVVERTSCGVHKLPYHWKISLANERNEYFWQNINFQIIFGLCFTHFLSQFLKI